LPIISENYYDPTGCYGNYISIASYNKPEEYYKLCGQKRNVKFITTYNNVLINFVSKSIKDVSSGFSAVFKMISDPSACKFGAKIYTP
jgi:hypothetical protein